jgi:hypothetical protein
MLLSKVKTSNTPTSIFLKGEPSIEMNLRILDRILKLDTISIHQYPSCFLIVGTLQLWVTLTHNNS